MDSLILKIAAKIKKDPSDCVAYEDLLRVVNTEPVKTKELVNVIKEIHEVCMKEVPVLARTNLEKAQQLMMLDKRLLCVIASEDFDAFMTYVEWNREPSKKFYIPRKGALKPVVDSLQELADGNLDLLAISLPPGVGKLLSDDTEVLTRNGWKRHGDLVVGDEVIGLDGKFKKVLRVFPKHIANYEVIFSNGEKVKCHENHEWCVKRSTTDGSSIHIRSTKQILEDGLNKWVLPKGKPLEVENKKLPIHPYLMGLWVGRNDRDRMMVFPYMIVDKLEEKGLHFRRVWETAPTVEIIIDDDKYAYLKNITNEIPAEYLTASLEQRGELFAGLKDGCRRWNKDESVCLDSLMGTFANNPKNAMAICGKNIPSFNPVQFVSIKKIKSVPGNCIEVEDGIYRIGRTLIPTHNSTLAIFFLCWLAGKIPDKPMLTGSHSNAFVRGVYDECLRVFDRNGEYLWNDVFPTVNVVNTNAKDCRIDLGKQKRFETLEFTSIGTGNAGLYRAATLLYCDDLVSGIEVALSKDRLDKLWETYTTDLRQRKIGNSCRELHIATRWSVHDVIGRLEREYGDSDRAKFITVPAMDDNDESNFDYPYGVGFTTQFYREQRNIMDDTNWKALYMNQPIEREGLLYNKEELRRYFELPDREPDAILSVCDTKDRGSDYCVMPIAYKYGEDYYIEDVICDNSNPDVVETRLGMILMKHKVHMSCFESNSAGGRVAQKVQEDVKNKGGRTKITTKYTTANKDTKIIVNSPFIKEHFLFKDDSVIVSDKEYRRMLGFLCSYSMTGKNKHDDVPDAMAQLAEYVQNSMKGTIEVIRRPF